MKYNENNSPKRRTAKRRKGQKLSEQNEERAQNRKKQEFRRKSSKVKKEEGAEDRKVPILSIPKEKNYFPGEKLKKKIWQAETLIKEEIEQTLSGAKKNGPFSFFRIYFKMLKTGCWQR